MHKSKVTGMQRRQLLLSLSLQRAQCSNNIHTSPSSYQQSHYEVLGVAQDASLKQIKNAFYTLSKKYHPDMLGQQQSNAECASKFMAIKTAYDILRDAKKRRVYDSQLSHSSTPHGSNPPSWSTPFYHPHNSHYPNYQQTTFYSYRYRTSRARTQQTSYTQAEYERMFDEFRKRYENEEYQAYHEQMQQRSYEEALRRRYDFLRRNGMNASRYRTNASDKASRSDFSGFDPFGSNFEMLNKILTIYLIVFFAVAITSTAYQRTGGFEFDFGNSQSSSSSQTEAERQEGSSNDKEEHLQRINKMMMSYPPQSPQR